MGTVRIAARYVYTLETLEPIRNGFVEYDETDGTILDTGVCRDDEEIIDGALVPGFVNAHCHVELSHLHGKFYKGSGMAGFIDQINALRDWAGREVKQCLVQKWMDRMWSDGVSAMADISNDDSSFDVKAVHRIYTRTFPVATYKKKSIPFYQIPSVRKTVKILAQIILYCNSL